MNVQIQKKEETATLEDAETSSASSNNPKHNMILRSHTRAAEGNDQHLEDTSTQEQETAFAGPAVTALPSDRDLQEYTPSRLAFYNKIKPTIEGDYSFEAFTHRAYSTMVYANRISLKQALQEQNAIKRKQARKP